MTSDTWTAGATMERSATRALTRTPIKDEKHTIAQTKRICKQTLFAGTVVSKNGQRAL